MDVLLLIGIAISGGIVAFISFFVIIGRKITQPTKDLESKIKSLENEIKELKEKKSNLT